MEETINYKVSIDESDLVTKLTDIRRKIDNIMGGAVIGAVSLDNTVKEGFTAVGGVVQRSTDMLRASYNDMLYQSSISGPESTRYRRLSDLDEQSRFSSWLGMGGIGYNPARDLMTQQEFINRSRRNFLTVDDPLSPLVGLGTAAMVGGTIGGPAGFILGGAAGIATGWASQAVMGTLGRPYRETRDLGRLIEEASLRFVGGPLDPAEAYESARMIRNLARDRMLISEGFSRGEINDLARFALNTDLISNIRSPQELRDKLKQYLDSTREIMQTLRVTNEEAFKIYDELEEAGIVPRNMRVGTFVRASALRGRGVGLTSQEMLIAAQQGGRIVQTVGGTDFVGAAAGTQELAIALRQAVRDGLIESSLIARAGGVNQFAANIQQSMAANVAANPLLALMVANPNVNDVNGLLSIAGQYTDPMDILRLRGQARNLGAARPLEALGGIVRTAAITFGEVFPGRPLDPFALQEYLMETYGLDPGTAQFGIKYFYQTPEAARTSRFRTRLAELSGAMGTTRVEPGGALWGLMSSLKGAGASVDESFLRLFESLSAEPQRAKRTTLEDLTRMLSEDIPSDFDEPHKGVFESAGRKILSRSANLSEEMIDSLFLQIATPEELSKYYAILGFSAMEKTPLKRTTLKSVLSGISATGIMASQFRHYAPFNYRIFKGVESLVSTLSDEERLAEATYGRAGIAGLVKPHRGAITLSADYFAQMIREGAFADTSNVEKIIYDIQKSFPMHPQLGQQYLNSLDPGSPGNPLRVILVNPETGVDAKVSTILTTQ